MIPGVWGCSDARFSEAAETGTLTDLSGSTLCGRGAHRPPQRGECGYRRLSDGHGIITADVERDVLERNFAVASVLAESWGWRSDQSHAENAGIWDWGARNRVLTIRYEGLTGSTLFGHS